MSALMTPDMQAMARLVKLRGEVFQDLQLEVRAGLKKPPASEGFTRLTHAIDYLAKGGAQ